MRLLSWSTADIGSTRWWLEYAIFRTTGYCNHTVVAAKWVRGSEHCKLAWDAENSYRKHGLQGEPRKRSGRDSS